MYCFKLRLFHVDLRMSCLASRSHSAVEVFHRGLPLSKPPRSWHQVRDEEDSSRQCAKGPDRVQSDRRRVIGSIVYKCLGVFAEIWGRICAIPSMRAIANVGCRCSEIAPDSDSNVQPSPILCQAIGSTERRQPPGVDHGVEQQNRYWSIRLCHHRSLKPVVCRALLMVHVLVSLMLSHHIQGRDRSARDESLILMPLVRTMHQPYT